MSIAQSLLPEFDHEMSVTRRVLERVPEDQLDYKPTPKSMSLARLAGHVAEMGTWGVVTLTREELDFATGEFEALEMKSRDQVLAEFDRAVAQARAALAASSDQDLMKTWTLKMGDHVLFQQPRIGVLRGFVLSHGIHHRGQLSVYLRLLGVPVPSIYGPSGDEGQMGG